MIEYIEIRNQNLVFQGILDTALSVIWHSVYNGCGDFEIYAEATEQNRNLLKVGYFAKRIDVDEIAIIESIVIDYDRERGRMITATGRMAKSILDRRYIFYSKNASGISYTLQNKPIKGLVEAAVRRLVRDQAINCGFYAYRNIPNLELGTLKGYTERIGADDEDQENKQTEEQNLLEYTDSVLNEYDLSARIVLSDTLKLQYEVFKGADRTLGNTDENDPVIFSQDLDNLSGSEYSYDTANYKNVSLVGGEGDGSERFFAYLHEGSTSGLNLRESFVDASSISRTMPEQDVADLYPTGYYEDYGLTYVVDGVAYADFYYEDDELLEEYGLDDLLGAFPTGYGEGTQFYVSGRLYARAGVTYDEEETPTYEPWRLTTLGLLKYKQNTDEDVNFKLREGAYSKVLESKAKQQLAELATVETFSGTIDLNSTQYEINSDFFLGDKVTIQDIELDKNINVRILEILETQDENGYSIEVVYG